MVIPEEGEGTRGWGNNNLWCNICPKCAFVFLILSNFLSIDELKNIFWENLFEKEELKETFRELVWFSIHKPFECVWTYEESFLSIYNAINKYCNLPLDLREGAQRADGLDNGFVILNDMKNKVLEESKKIDIKKLEDKLLKIYDDDIIPQIFKDKLKSI